MSQTPTYLVPKNTASVLRAVDSRCQHLGLLLGRQRIIQTDQERHKNRKNSVARPLAEDYRAPKLQGGHKRLATPAERRLHSLAGGDRRTEWFQAQNKGRLVVGLGGKGVLEFGITLQHVTGLPIIPGSALKGLARTYALLIIAENLGIPVLKLRQLQKLKDSKVDSPLEILDAALVAPDAERREALALLTKALANVDIQIVNHLAQKLNGFPEAAHYRAAFGSQEASGECIFYDAVVAKLPSSSTLFDLDVMTPHFKKYYDDVNSGSPTFNKPPHDGQSPVPVSFVTVAAGTTFAFAVGLRPGGDRKVVKRAVAWLKAALHELGVGAKTAAGYGVFEVPEQA